jgi:hypothetical protein
VEATREVARAHRHAIGERRKAATASSCRCATASTNWPTRGGLLLQPDPAAQGEGQAVKFVLPDAVKPVAMLELALQDIGRRYGEWTADFVSLQLEYPR